jgi:uncharacterized protein
VPYRISAEEVKRHTRADGVAERRQAYRAESNPSFATHGPRTRREFFNLLRSGQA